MNPIMPDLMNTGFFCMNKLKILSDNATFRLSVPSFIRISSNNDGYLLFSPFKWMDAGT